MHVLAPPVPHGWRMPAPMPMSIMVSVSARRHWREVMFVRDGAERREATIVGIGLLDLLAIIDARRRRPQRRGGQAETERHADRYDVSQISHPLKIAPVFSATSATIRPATASISASVSVLSRGCRVTAIAIDFLPSGTPEPS